MLPVVVLLRLHTAPTTYISTAGQGSLYFACEVILRAKRLHDLHCFYGCERAVKLRPHNAVTQAKLDAEK